MELLYLFIPQYKTIIKQGFNFTNRFQFTCSKIEEDFYQVEQNEIPNNGKLWQSNFFDKKISNLTVLVGGNGSGKTSILEFITNELTIGGNSLGYDYLAIFESSGKIVIKSRQEKFKYKFEFVLDKEIDGVDVISYYPLSDFNFSNPFSNNQIGSVINISDNAIIYEDFEREKNENRSLFGQISFNEAVSAFIGSNIIRELEFFLNDHIGEVKPAHILSLQVSDISEYINKEIIIAESFIEQYKKEEDLVRSYRDILFNLEYLREIVTRKTPNLPRPNSDRYIFVRALTMMLLLDVQTQFGQALRQIKDERLDKIVSESSKKLALAIDKLKRSNLLESNFLECLQDITAVQEKNLNISNRALIIAKFIVDHLDWASQTKSVKKKKLNQALDLERKEMLKESATLNLFFQEYESRTKDLIADLTKIVFSSKIISYSWRSDMLKGYQYSTGEQQLIKLYSRLIYAFNKLNGKKSSGYCLLLLDEAELGMHPEWQKKFIRWLIEFLKVNITENKSVQIIITTHSPLMLSDVPAQNVIRLENGKIWPYTINSFGANIYDLLNDSFFLKKGFIGEFAKERITSLVDFIESGERENREWNIKKAAEVIELIGEPLIREEIRELFLKQYLEVLDKEQLNAQIEFLTKYRDLNME